MSFQWISVVLSALCVSQCVCVCVTVCIPVSLSVSVCQCVSLCVCHCVYHCVSVCLCVTKRSCRRLQTGSSALCPTCFHPCFHQLHAFSFCAGKDVDLYLLCANSPIFQTLSFLSIPFLEETGSTGDQITFILAK